MAAVDAAWQSPCTEHTGQLANGNNYVCDPPKLVLCTGSRADQSLPEMTNGDLLSVP